MTVGGETGAKSTGLVRRIARRARGVLVSWRRSLKPMSDWMPKGLYARSLLIVILPVVILQTVLAFVFLERHWQLVTGRLSEAVTRDIAAIIAVIETYPQDAEMETITQIARKELDLSISFLPADALPAPAPKPFLSLLDHELSEGISRIVARPFWIDTVGRSDFVEVRVQLENKVLRVVAKRSRAYASNWHIFIVWMVGTAFVLLTVAILFLRNQIRPMQQLAAAAADFGKGRAAPTLRPRGAREVRQATAAYNEMRRRIERHVEQRTTMLAGVSHDLRTVLTRFKLQVALLPESAETDAMSRDVDEMQAMLEAYLAFARGDADESAVATDVGALLNDLKSESDRLGFDVTASFEGDPMVTVKPTAFKRLVANLVVNGARYADRVMVHGRHASGWLTITIDDDGPGVPTEERENVFRPFYRLDQARNQDEGGTGLGLAIARDIARGHGGDIRLDESPLGGLRAVIRVPG
jgi:two-component system, OmpR family, osmolarity sensor histidine kinase EnvZ